MTRDEIALEMKRLNLTIVEDNKNNLLHVINQRQTVENAILDLTIRESLGKKREERKTVQQVKIEIKAIAR